MTREAKNQSGMLSNYTGISIVTIATRTLRCTSVSRWQSSCMLSLPSARLHCGICSSFDCTTTAAWWTCTGGCTEPRRSFFCLTISRFPMKSWTSFVAKLSNGEGKKANGEKWLFMITYGSKKRYLYYLINLSRCERSKQILFQVSFDFFSSLCKRCVVC